MVNRREFSVRGDGVGELPDIFYDELTEERTGNVERYEGGEFSVVVVEEYYFRNNSDQQATVIFERSGEDALLVTIISGGGGSGLFRINLGSHSTQTEKIANRLLEICDSAEKRVEVTDRIEER